MTSKPRLYWDSSIFLAWLKEESSHGKEVMQGIAEQATQIQNDEAVLITSILTKAEILRGTLAAPTRILLDRLFMRSNVTVHETNLRVWETCHELRDFYRQDNLKDNLPTLTVPDAIHLATAILYAPCEFYTLDAINKTGRAGRRALIPLSGVVAGKYTLVIKKPLARNLSMF